MAKHKLMVLSNAMPGQDDAFIRWYDDVHIPDMCKIPGVTRAERFALKSDKWRYLAIYELDCDDADDVVAELGARASTGALQISEALDQSSYHMAIATPAHGQR